MRSLTVLVRSVALQPNVYPSGLAGLACSCTLPIMASEIEQPRVSALPHTAGARLGCSVATLDDLAVIGACDEAHAGADSAGAVHVLSLSSPRAALLQVADRSNSYCGVMG